MRACSALFTKRISASPFVSLDDFHQKLIVPGPVIVVCRTADWLSFTVRLRAASTRSCLTMGCPIQPGELVTQVKAVVSSASASGRTGVKVSTVFELVAVPPRFVTSSEYVPARFDDMLVMRRIMFVAPLMSPSFTSGTPLKRQR